jgi:predicted DNA repair protein MutK
MAISLASVATRPILEQAGALVIVAVLITAGVYGAVGLIVKMDDIGLHLARRRSSGAQLTGRALVRAMPLLMEALSDIGTFAMLWVGGGILLHGLEEYGFRSVPDFVHGLAHHIAEWAGPLAGVADWAVGAVAAAIVAALVGLLVVMAHGAFLRLRHGQRAA